MDPIFTPVAPAEEHLRTQVRREIADLVYAKENGSWDDVLEQRLQRRRLELRLLGETR